MQINDYRDKLPKHPVKEWELRDKNIKLLVLHCTERDWGLFETAEYHISQNHIDNTGCPSICYHYFIDKNGDIFYCVDEKYKTWHVGLWNKFAIGVSLQYLGGAEKLSDKMYDSAKYLFAFLLKKYKLNTNNIYGHRELPVTGYRINSDGKKIFRKSCPGLQINLSQFREDIKNILLNQK